MMWIGRDMGVGPAPVVLGLAVCCASAQPEPAKKVTVVEGQLFDHNGAGIARVLVRLLPADAAADANALATDQTNHYGDFRLETDSSLTGSFAVVFTKEGYAETSRAVELTPDEPPPFLDLQLPGSLVFAGSVTDRLNGRPVQGARVRLLAAGRDWGVATGSDGAFRVEGIVPGPGRLQVDADRFARSTTEVEIRDGVEPAMVSLSPERIVRIRVVDTETALPIEGVHAETVEEETNDFRSRMTDERGVAEIRGLNTETLSLRLRLVHRDYVSDPDYDRELTLPSDARESVHEFGLLRGGAVVGTVIGGSADYPLQGVRVTVGESRSTSPAREWTDFDGAFRVSGVTPGDTVVTAYLTGFAPQMQRIAVDSGRETTVRFRMPVSATAEGVVVDAEDKPIAGAYLAAESWRGEDALLIETIADADGRFVFSTIPEDSFTVSLHAGGYASASGGKIVPGKSDHRFVLNVQVRQPRSAKTLNVGDPFPELQMTTLDGRPCRVSDWKGKTVLVDFWATWCGPCVAEIPHLRRVQEAFGSRKDFELIGISIDFDADEKRVRKFIEDKKIGWPQVFGTKGNAQAAAEACGVESIPQTFLVDPQGVIRATDLFGPTVRDRIEEFLKDEGDS